MQRFVFLLIAGFGTISAFAQQNYRIKEIEVTPAGMLREVVICLYNTFEIHIGKTGIIRSVEVVTYGDASQEFRFSTDRIERIGKGLEACRFDGNRIERIGNFLFRYHSGSVPRIEVIGDTLFSYVASGRNAGSIERIGGLEFKYSVAEGRIESIGSLKAEYRVGDKMLDGFSRIFAREKEQTFAIRITNPLHE